MKCETGRYIYTVDLFMMAPSREGFQTKTNEAFTH